MIERKQAESIEQGCRKIDTILAKRKKSKVPENENVKYVVGGVCMSFYSGTYAELHLRQLFLGEITRLFKIRDKVVLVNLSSGGTIKSFFSKADVLNRQETPYLTTREPEIAGKTEYEYIIEDEKAKYLVVCCYFSEYISKDLSSSFAELSIETRTLKNVKEFKKVCRYHPPYPVNALKVFSNKDENKEIFDNTYNQREGLFKCRPHILRNSKEYSFDLTDEAKDIIFEKCKIISFVGFDEAESACDKSYLYGSTADAAESAFPRNTHYDMEPNEIISGEREILNVGEVLDQAGGKKSNGDIWCKLEDGYTVIPQGKLSIWLEFQAQSSITGKKTYTGCSLGFPKESKGLSYVDWSLFFIHDFLDIKPDIYNTDIPKGTPCRIVDYSYESADQEIYLPKGTVLSTLSLPGTEEYAELSTVSLKIYVYYYLKGTKVAQIDYKSKLCTVSLGRIFTGRIPYTVKDGVLSDICDKDDLNKFTKENSKETFSAEGSYQKVKDFFNKFILPELFLKVQYSDFIKDENLYVFNFDITEDEICGKFNLQKPVCIRTAAAAGILSTGDTVKLFRQKRIETAASLDREFKKNNVSLRSGDGETFEATIDNKLYLFDKAEYDKCSTNSLQDYIDSIKPLNFSSGSLHAAVDTSVCPEDKLLCKMPELKEKLKDAGIDKSCLSDGNYLYGNDGYKTGLLSYFINTMSHHPLEKSEEAYKTISKGDRELLDIPEFTDKSVDIYNSLKKKDSVEFSQNSFYFIYPPKFLDALHDSGIYGTNPYEDKYLQPLLSEKDAPVHAVFCPGFAPAVEDENRDRHRFPDEFMMELNGRKLYWAALNCPYGKSFSYNNNDHTGVDFPRLRL